MESTTVVAAEPEVKQEVPVATEPKVEPDQTQPEAEKKPEQPEQKPEEKPSRIQNRIDKLTREKYELKGRLDAYEKMSGVKPAEQQGQPKPNRDQFANDSDFVEALTDWKVTQRLPQIAQQAQQTSQRTTVEQAFANREAAIKAEIKDYDDVIAEAADVVIPQDVAEAILTSDLGPNIRYYLATHVDEAEKLNQMPAAAAVRQIGRLEAKLESEKKVYHPVTKAPAPITPVNSGGGAVETDLDKLPIKDFMKARNKAEIAKHKR
jgi:hypothetical protein